MMQRLFCLLILIFILDCSQKEIHLQFQYNHLVSQRYWLALNMEGEVGDGATASSFYSKINLQVRDSIVQVFPNGDAVMEIHLDSAAVDADPGTLPELNHSVQVLRTARIRAKCSAFGELLELEGLEDLPKAEIGGLDLGSVLFKLNPQLPHAPVQVGDTWDREQRFTVETGVSKATLYFNKRFRLVAVENYKNRPCAKIAVDFRAQIGVKDAKTIAFVSQAGRLVQGTGLLYFDVREGCLVEGSVDLSTEARVELPDPNTQKTASFPSKVKQHLKMSLLERS